MTKKDYKYLMDKKEYILEHIRLFKLKGILHPDMCRINCKYGKIDCTKLYYVDIIARILKTTDYTKIANFYKIQDIKEKLK